MITKHLALLFLLCFVAGSQISCRRPAPSSGSDPSSSTTPDQTAVINQIVERYIEVIGGQAAIERVMSYQAKGTFELSVMREGGSFETWGKEPRKSLTVIEFPRIGTLRKGFDGETLWVQTPSGTFTDSSQEQIAEVERDAEVYRAGRLKNLYEKITLENKARLNGRDVYVIEGKPTTGPAEKLYFDVENGLLVRWDMARRNPKRGTLFVKVHLNDYRDVDGVKVPFNVRFSFESFSFTLHMAEMKHNVPIDDAIFKKP